MNKTFIIAEAGVNHNGSVKMAKQLIDVASDAGADAVKFQTFKAEKLVSKQAQKAEYQKETSGSEESQFEMIKKLELDIDTHQELISYCAETGVMFLSTPFDLESIQLLDRLGIDIFKVPSGEITNLPYLRAVGALKKKIILSTGMSTMSEIKDALLVLEQSGTSKENTTVLHANTEYPTPYHDVNLRAMNTISEECKVRVGYSDHTPGIEVPIAAVTLGACVIEKHFTLDRTLPGPDHKASLEPNELKQMVTSIRNIEIALGSIVKQPSPSEIKNMVAARKSIVAAKIINKGEILSEDNLICKRPSTGVSPMEWDKIVGKKAKRYYDVDSLIELSYLID